jgi:uncharacterized membrane protein YbhN (UPF0104 family)
MHETARTDPTAPHRSLTQRIGHLLGPLVGIVIMVAAFWILRRELKHHSLSEIVGAVRAIPPHRIAIALGLTAFNYFWLSGYDAIGVRYLQHPLRAGRVLVGGIVGYAMSHNFGWLMGGTASRFRLYSAWGFSTLEIIKLFAVLGLTFAIGFCTLGGLVFTTDPLPLPDDLRQVLAHAHLPLDSTFWLGPVCLAILGLYLVACGLHEQLPLRGRWIELPKLRLAALQMLVPTVDLLLYSSVIYVLLPPEATISFWRFANVGLIALGLGIVSHVPGGVGVIEAVVLELVPNVDSAQLIGTLIVFRVIYYLLPLMFAAALLGAHELLSQQHRVRGFFRWFGRRSS